MHAIRAKILAPAMYVLAERCERVLLLATISVRLMRLHPPRGPSPSAAGARAGPLSLSVPTCVRYGRFNFSAFSQPFLFGGVTGLES